MTAPMGKVLIAEDEGHIRDLYERYLGRFGYEVRIVPDGSEVLPTLEKFDPDIILLDVMMPTMTGLEVCRLLKSNPQTRHIPVVLTTGMNEERDIVNGLGAGADDYLCKPLRYEELNVRMANLIRRRRAFGALYQERVGLLDALGQKAQITTSLYALSVQMNEAQSLDDLLQVLASGLAQILDHSRVLVLRPDPGAKVLRVASSVGVPHAMAQAVEFAVPIEADVFRRYDPQLLGERASSGPLTGLRRALPFGDDVMVVVSLVAGAETVGVVVLLSYPKPTLTDDHRMVLKYVAPLAAVMIKNWLRHMQIRETQDVTIFSLALLAESRDAVTGNHLRRVQAYCRLLAEWLAKHSRRLAAQMPAGFAEELERTAPLHDIGKVAVTDQVLLKPDSLTTDEARQMQLHTIIGGRNLEEAERRLRHDSFLSMAKEICYSHHEKWDGTGYPHGLKGDEIPLSARIVACADVYDALTTRRPYKQAFSHAEAVGIIAEGRGSHFDPEVCDAFQALANEFDRVRKQLQDPGGIAQSDDTPVGLKRFAVS